MNIEDGLQLLIALLRLEGTLCKSVKQRYSLKYILMLNSAFITKILIFAGIFKLQLKSASMKLPSNLPKFGSKLFIFIVAPTIKVIA